MNKRNLMLLAAGVAGAGSLLAGAHFVAAANTSTSLSDALAQKLNVSSSDVQDALTSYRDEQEAARTADRKTQYETQLTQAVTDGKLTEDQKTKLLAEYDTVTAKMTDLQKQMQQIRTDAEQWASENGIDTQYLPGGPSIGGGHGGHGGPGGPGGMVKMDRGL